MLPTTAPTVPGGNPFRQLEIQAQPAETPPARRRVFHPAWAGLAVVALLAALACLAPQYLKPASPASLPPATAAPLKTGTVSSAFGLRDGRPHQGIDVAARTGTPIYAFKPGTVVFSGWESGYGRSVVVDHGDGLQSRYAHCAKLLVQAGDTVSTGVPIARVGSTGHSTGPHLHFEILRHGRPQNPAWFIDFDRHLAYGAPAPQARPAFWQAPRLRLPHWQPNAGTVSVLAPRSFAH